MASSSAKVSKSKKKNFFSFSYAEAFKQLNLDDLIPWELDVPPLEPSAFFQERQGFRRC